MKSLRAFSSHLMQDFRAAGDSANGKDCPGGTAACGRDSLWIQTDLSSSLWKKLTPRQGQGVTLEQRHISGTCQAEKGVLVVPIPVELLKSEQYLGCAQRALRRQTWG